MPRFLPSWLWNSNQAYFSKHKVPSPKFQPRIEPLEVRNLLAAFTFNYALGFGGTKTDTGQSITHDAAGNIYITGTGGDISFGGTTITNPTPGIMPGFVAKLNSVGTCIWARPYGSTHGIPRLQLPLITPPLLMLMVDLSGLSRVGLGLAGA